MEKPSYQELQSQVEKLKGKISELRHILNLKVYPQNLHFETKDLLYFRIDRDWYFDFFDRRLADLTGYALEDFRNKNLSWLQIIHEADRESALQAVKNGMKEDKFYQAEFRIVKKEGGIAWVKMRGPILCDNRGRLLAIQGILDDITARKNMEIAIESEHEVFTWVANSMDDGIYIVSEDYRIQFMNDALIAMVGDHVGKICYQALFQRDSVCPWSVMDIMRQEVCGFQEYHLERLGRTFQVRSFPVKRRDGSIGKIGQLKDITKAKKLENEIEGYTVQHQAIVDAANVADLGIFISQDFEGIEACFRYANEAFCRITGYRPEELAKMSMADLVPADMVRKVMDRYRRRQRGETINHAYELKMIRKDQKLLTCLISVALSSYDGKVATVGFLRDLTEKKKFEKSLWLSQRLASIGRLAAEVAHEINNPLTSVLTFAKLLERITGQDPFPLERLSDVRQYVSFLESETTRCVGIARNLLDFSRHGEIDLQENDVHKILDKTLDVLRHRAQMNGIEIVTSYDPGVPFFYCDFKRLQQAFMNIFWNAMEAMPNGGALRVSTGFESSAETVRVDIEDTGTGIAEENIEDIFEPFFTTKAEGKGVGLGLSVAYGIIRQHHGKITVQSEVGKGTHFTIMFRLKSHKPLEFSNGGPDYSEEIGAEPE